jgi:hypothetical protein
VELKLNQKSVTMSKTFEKKLKCSNSMVNNFCSAVFHLLACIREIKGERDTEREREREREKP